MAPGAVDALAFRAAMLRALCSADEAGAWLRLRSASESIADLALSTVQAVDEYAVEQRGASDGADLIMVLGFRLTNDGRASQRLLRRLEVTSRLATDLPDAKVLVSGGAVGLTAVSEASVMARRLRQLGVASERVLIERHSRDTLENIQYGRQFAADENARSVIVVSDEPHLTRATSLLRLTGEFEKVSPVSSAPHRAFTAVERSATYRDALRLRGFRLHAERTPDLEARFVEIDGVDASVTCDTAQ